MILRTGHAESGYRSILRALCRPQSRCLIRLQARSQHTAHRKQCRLPASYYRGGTSRALMFKEEDLPHDRSAWSKIFLRALGSPDPNGRQLDGMGGGVSSLSKICIVGPPTHEDADVDYTFVAIGVKDDEVDFSANCGNMTAAIGPFAVDNGMISDDLEDLHHVCVRIHNTNTGKVIRSTFPVVDDEAVPEGSFAIDGVAGTGAKIELAFMDPAGSKTGSLLPTGNVTDEIDGISATCIDAGNPCVFVTASSLSSLSTPLSPPILGTILPSATDNHPTLLARLDSIRRQAAVLMGLASSVDKTPGSIPKIAMISSPSSHELLSGAKLHASDVDLVVRAISVGNPHKAVPLTVSMAIAAAARLEGSVVKECLGTQSRVRGAASDELVLGHPSGKMIVGAQFDAHGQLENAKVYSTARRLMEGTVFWKG